MVDKCTQKLYTVLLENIFDAMNNLKDQYSTN